jgi:RNase P protein component
VRRNRAKRRLRAALDGVQLQDGHEYVVIASEAVLTAPFGQVVGWLRRAIEEEKRDD